ncbi:recombinase family protein [Mesorhizobium sp. L-2-11]|uniref:recombinase family protein n=1 Tax=Mesorhizobium sp. L-2-11 TaxID=2744521 RepID=UPI001FD0772C|nr:recombinase family protein [Mesorhizobium sp. L-2-11]
MDRITSAGAGLRSLPEAIDMTTAARRMMMYMVGSCAEFERAMIRDHDRRCSGTLRRTNWETP